MAPKIKAETEAERAARVAAEKAKAEAQTAGAADGTTADTTTTSSSRSKKVNWSTTQGPVAWTGGKPIASTKTTTKPITDAKNYMNPSSAEYPWLVENYKAAKANGLTSARTPISYWKTLVDQAYANSKTPFEMGKAYASGDLTGLDTTTDTTGTLTKEEKALQLELKNLNAALKTDPGAELTGQSGQFQQKLTQYADSMGLFKGRAEINSYVKNILEGKTTSNDALADMRKQATVLYPNFADRLTNTDLTVKDLVNPYLQVMADTLEIDPNTVKLTDPTIQKAISGKEVRSLSDFRTDMRADSRFATTRTAKREAVDFAQSLLKGFGYNV